MYDKNGYDKYGYDRKGYNKYGLDRNGYDKEGYNKEGYDKEGYNKAGYNSGGYNKEGYNRTGYDIYGFNERGINKYTNTIYDRYGYDREGYNQDGYDKYGYDRDGYNKYGYDRRGYDKDGYNKEGYDKEGYNRIGFDREGINKETGTQYNKEGFDKEGYDKEGYDKEGYDKTGYNKYLINKKGINKETGTKDDRIILVEEWLGTKYSMGLFAKKNNISEENFFEIVETVKKIYPKLSESIEQKNNRTREVVLFKNKGIAKKMLTGELGVEEFAKDRHLKCDFDLMFRLLKSKEEKTRLTSLILDFINSDNVEITDYFNMFAKGKYKSESFKEVEKQLETLDGLCKNIPELRKYLNGIKKQKRFVQSYKNPFERNEVSKMGFVDPKTNEVKMVEITDEIVESAKKYIYATENFLCSKTMQITMMKIIKEELTKEQIDELYESKLQREKKNTTPQEIGEAGFEVGIGDIEKFDEAERVLENLVEKEKEGGKNKNE